MFYWRSRTNEKTLYRCDPDLAYIRDYRGLLLAHNKISEGNMKALSIRQPWAWLIAEGHKDIENRSRRYHFKGPILIHAPLQIDPYASLTMGFQGIDIDIPADLPRGGIIGQTEIVDRVVDSDSKWFTGKYGYVLRNSEPLPFRPCKGQLGFFTPDYNSKYKDQT